MLRFCASRFQVFNFGCRRALSSTVVPHELHQPPCSNYKLPATNDVCHYYFFWIHELLLTTEEWARLFLFRVRWASIPGTVPIRLRKRIASRSRTLAPHCRDADKGSELLVSAPLKFICNMPETLASPRTRASRKKRKKNEHILQYPVSPHQGVWFTLGYLSM